MSAFSGEPRPDLDRPGPNDAYVIRIENAAGYRLKTTASHAEVERAGGEGTAKMLVAKVTGLIDAFAQTGDYAPTPSGALVDFICARDPDEPKLVEWAKKWGVEIRPIPTQEESDGNA